MTIDRQCVELRDGTLVLDTPKSAAGVRTVHIPPHLLPELRFHDLRHTGNTLPPPPAPAQGADGPDGPRLHAPR